MGYSGKLYRALNPIYAHDPLSGAGAQKYGGRFNAKGVAALYTSRTALTALREANQIGNLQPTTLVCYEAEIERIFDTRNLGALTAEGITPNQLAADTWRNDMMKLGVSQTQAFANKLILGGYHGILVRSFAAGAGMDEMNLVLWSWGPSTPSKLILIDDEGRLSPK
ncbi:RES family NAD+ phosphorylase [Boseaceae bacterium BT-24-1]|nr:RES family NAD+ phosphorylase [Boseaceae bacterium BT-24-1]